MKNLLVPVDFSDASVTIIEKAGELAQELPARITLLHVDEPKATQMELGGGAPLGLVTWPLRTPTRISKHKARLKSLAYPLTASGVAVESVSRMGLVVNEILEQAEKCAADFIILGSHGHLAAQHLFNGNVFTTILRQTEFPVIVVPVKGDA